MSQPYLIDIIILSVPSMKDTRNGTKTAVAEIILTKDLEGEERKEHWSYIFIIGMLNYIVNCTHPEMSFAVHQYDRFCNDP